MWWALRTFAPLLHAPTGGPWSFGPRSSFVAAPVRLPPERADESVRWLVRRYLEGFGPASVQDVAQFTLLRRPVVRDALVAQAGDVEQLEDPDGSELFDVPGSPLPPEDTPAPPRLLPKWDSTLLAYADRSRVFHELPDQAWAGLAAEAGGLVAFLADREPMVYRGYTYWWDKLPVGVVRVLPG